jgi:hypothetical protein
VLTASGALPKIQGNLHAQMELRLGAGQLGKAQRHIGGHDALAGQNGIERRPGHLHAPRGYRD